MADVGSALQSQVVEPQVVVHEAPTPVVGIGASAGGLEALEAFFEQVPLDSGFAFVVVQHLGSEFVVRLPFSTREPLAPPRREVEGMSNSHQQTPLKVVIVEDNDDSRMMLCELLELSGFECHTASTGRLGLDVISELRPDVALVDIGLPELDGLEVARLLRQDHRNDKLLLVALTGYGQREDREAARGAGFDTHLVKPVDFDTLLNTLRAYAEKRAARITPGLDDTLPAC